MESTNFSRSTPRRFVGLEQQHLKNALFKHPHIDSFQAQSTLEYRLLRGSFKSIDELRQLMYFSEHGVQRFFFT